MSRSELRPSPKAFVQVTLMSSAALRRCVTFPNVVQSATALNKPGQREQLAKSTGWQRALNDPALAESVVVRFAAHTRRS